MTYVAFDNISINQHVRNYIYFFNSALFQFLDCTHYFCSKIDFLAVFSTDEINVKILMKILTFLK